MDTPVDMATPLNTKIDNEANDSAIKQRSVTPLRFFSCFAIFLIGFLYLHLSEKDNDHNDTKHAEQAQPQIPQLPTVHHLSNETIKELYEMLENVEKNENKNNESEYEYNDNNDEGMLLMDNPSVTIVHSGKSKQITICHRGFGNGDFVFPVTCWDEDTADADDLMGVAMVPKNGCAAVRYEDIYWDVNWWSSDPDIFCEIYYEGKTLTTDIQQDHDPDKGLTITFTVPYGKKCYQPTPFSASSCCLLPQCGTYGCLVNGGGVDAKTPCNPPFTWLVCDGNGCSGKSDHCRSCRCEPMDLANHVALEWDIKTNALFYASVRDEAPPIGCTAPPCGNINRPLAAAQARRLSSANCDRL